MRRKRGWPRSFFIYKGTKKTDDGYGTSSSSSSSSSSRNNSNNKSNKKARLMMATSSSSSSNNSNSNNSNAVVLEDDLLVGTILSFLPLSFRFTAAVNRRFQRRYRQVHHGDTFTSFRHCVHTRNAAEIWLAETSHFNRSWYCNVAAQFGRLDILQFLKEERGCEWSVPRPPKVDTCACCNGCERLSMISGEVNVLGTP
jgi:hypothetical protein